MALTAGQIPGYFADIAAFCAGSSHCCRNLTRRRQKSVTWEKEGEREREDAGLGDLWEDGLCGVDGEGGRYREELVIAGRQAGQLGAARTRDLEWWVEVLLETSSWFLTDLVYAGAVLQTPL